jgi:RNA polymerase sigma factor (sigma-70 family)
MEDDDLDLLRRFTAYIQNVVHYARLEYFRTTEYTARESPLEQFPPEILGYEDPSPVINKGEFEFAEDKLSAAFSGLNLLRRRILTLIFVEELSAREVADKLNCSVDYVYLQKHRALKKLRDALINGGDSHGD